MLANYHTKICISLQQLDKTSFKSGIDLFDLEYFIKKFVLVYANPSTF